MSQLGRISGSVLKDNLLRQGVDLNFKNISSSTALLHLDATNQKIGVNTQSASDALTVAAQFKTSNLISTYNNIANFTVDTSRIEALGGDGNINFNAATNIFATAISTDNLKIDFNTISTTTADTNIELRPNGNGNVNIQSNWNITGSLHATGNIQTSGNFTLGNDDQDNVSFAADVNSNIIPDQTNTSDLGSPSKQWLNVYSTLINGAAVEIEDLVIGSGDTSLARRQGNTFYVSTLGNDSNVGDHQHGAFLTLKHALAQSDGSTAGPTVIQIFPGEYEEEFPLTVPSHVSITGEDIRNTIIKPTVATQSNNAFLVEDDVTIQNITIKDFYTGAAFSFTPGGFVNTRSPYIQNVSVITKGSVVSASDPRGFNQGDAGKGALIDGAVLDSTSLEASILFDNCMFITPGVDCITVTNGVRAELLNCFTYFANRGFYATQGSTGKVMPDTSTRYGAELRVLGSANIYGNYGVVADGANTLIYLVGHNFSYIGVGKDTSNDSTLVLSIQETTELNLGTIVYTSTDSTGSFRVGDNFYIDFITGGTSIDGDTVDFSGVGNISVINATSASYIDGSRVDTGNIRITGNTITTTDGDLILTASQNFNTTNNAGLTVSRGTDIQRNNEIADIRYNTESNLFEGYSSGNLSFGGIYSSDRQEGVYAHNTNNTIILTVAGIQVGTIDSNSTNLHSLSTGDISLNGNLITTTLSNSNLELKKGLGAATAALVHTLDNPNAYDTSNNDQFGKSIAISGNLAIVGAFGEDDAGGLSSGKAYIFNVTTGALVHTLDNPNPYSTSQSDFFGNSVAISGNSVIVGAYGEDRIAGAGSGRAYIFNATSGALLHTLSDPNAYGSSQYDSFGGSVAIDGNSAIVGARNEDEPNNLNSGKAYIYNVTSGALVHTLDNPNAYGTPQYDNFGNSVAISGNLAIVGAVQEDDAGGGYSGKAYIYNVTSGALVHTLDNPNAYGTSGGTFAGDSFGDSVAISGNSAIVGAYGEDDAGVNSSGKAYIFNVTTGALVHTLDNPNAYGTSGGDYFGDSVAISGNLAIVGAYLEDDAGGTSSGKAYIFNVTTGALLHTLDNPNAYDTSYNDKFSYSVAISSNSVILGAYQEDDAGGDNSGKAYIYTIPSGPNVVDVFDINIKENNLSNTSNNLFSLESTGKGYIKFDTTTGLVIPYGNNAARNVAPIIGESRYNNEDSESSFLEIWSGISWERAAGAGGEVTSEYLEGLSNLYVLVLG